MNELRYATPRHDQTNSRREPPLFTAPLDAPLHYPMCCAVRRHFVLQDTSRNPFNHDRRRRFPCLSSALDVMKEKTLSRFNLAADKSALYNLFSLSTLCASNLVNSLFGSVGAFRTDKGEEQNFRLDTYLAHQLVVGRFCGRFPKPLTGTLSQTFRSTVRIPTRSLRSIAVLFGSLIFFLITLESKWHLV